MIEHRLIEKMIRSVAELADCAETSQKIDPASIDRAVDFIRTYADKTHHGKEEDILFRDLATKDMSSGDDKMMRELVEEHKYGRKTVGELVAARNEYICGNSGALETVIAKLKAIAAFYPPHIAKEDKVFFPASMTYFSDKEKEDMLDEFWRFDREMIHKKYLSVTEEMEKAIEQPSQELQGRHRSAKGS